MKVSEAIASLIPRLRGGVPQVEERWPGNDGSTKHYSIGIANGLMAEAADHLAALSALPPDGEAVAWLKTWTTGSDHCQRVDLHPRIEPWLAECNPVVSPLYTHPSRGNADRSEGVTDRDALGRRVREAWVKWALTQPNPKPSWLVPYDKLSEPDKEADRQIGEALSPTHRNVNVITLLALVNALGLVLAAVPE